jgi:Polysaccharide pyruvyl transferase
VTTAWPPGRPRILVMDGCLADIGEGSVAMALHRILRRVAPEAAVLHAACHAEGVAGDLPGLAFVPPVHRLIGPAFAGWTPARGRALVAGTDLVLGSGSLLEPSAPWGLLQGYDEVLDLGRPVALVGQTVGPWHGAAGRACVRRLMCSARAVAVRDAASVLNALELGAVPEHLVLAGDLTLSLFADPPPVPAGDGVAVVIGGDPDALDGAGLGSRVLADTVAVAGGERITVIEDGGAGWAAAIEMIGTHRAVVTTSLQPALWAMAQGLPSALLLDSQESGTLDGVDTGGTLCTRPEVDALRRAAIAAALDPSALKGPALWHALAPARHRAALNAPALIGVLAELRRRPARSASQRAERPAGLT